MSVSGGSRAAAAPDSPKECRRLGRASTDVVRAFRGRKGSARIAPALLERIAEALRLTPAGIGRVLRSLSGVRTYLDILLRQVRVVRGSSCWQRN